MSRAPILYVTSGETPVTAAGARVYPTLSAAVDAAADGATIRLMAGVYDDPAGITIATKVDIDTVSDGVVIVRVGGSGIIVSSDCRIARLQLISSNPDVPAVTVVAGHATIDHCSMPSMRVDVNGHPTVQGCTITASAGSGLSVLGAAGGTYRGNTVRQHAHYGILCATLGAPMFEGNRVADVGCGAVLIMGSGESARRMREPATLRDNILDDARGNAANLAQEIGLPRACVAVAGGGSANLYGNTIFNGSGHGVVAAAEWRVLAASMSYALGLTAHTMRETYDVRPYAAHATRIVARGNTIRDSLAAGLFAVGPVIVDVTDDTYARNCNGAVRAEGGATVAIAAATVEYEAPSNCVGIAAHGRDTTLVLRDVQLSNCDVAAAVEAGARLELSNFHCTGANRGIIVDACATATVVRSSATSCGEGVSITNHGRAELTEMKFTKCATGCSASGGGAPEARSCVFERCDVGVWAHGGGGGSFSQCRFSGSTVSHAVCTTRCRTRFTDCAFDAPAAAIRAAVHCHTGGLPTFTGCEFRLDTGAVGPSSCAVAVESRADPTFSNCVFECSAGAPAVPTSPSPLVRCHMGGAGCFTASIFRGAYRSTSHAVVLGAGAQPTFRANSFVSFGDAAVRVEDDAGATFEANTIRDCGACGVRVAGKALETTVSANVIERCPVGVSVDSGAAAVVARNAIAECRDAGIRCYEGARPVVLQNQLHSNRIGLATQGVGSRPYAAFNHCHQNSIAGIFVHSGAAPFLQGNTISAERMGIVIEPAANARLLSNVISYCVVGIQASSVGRSELVDNVISNNGCGVAIAGPAGPAALADWWDTQDPAALALAWDAPVPPATSSLVEPSWTGLATSSNLISSNGVGVSVRGGIWRSDGGDTVAHNQRSGVSTHDGAHCELHAICLHANGARYNVLCGPTASSLSVVGAVVGGSEATLHAAGTRGKVRISDSRFFGAGVTIAAGCGAVVQRTMFIPRQDADTVPPCAVTLVGSGRAFVSDCCVSGHATGFALANTDAIVMHTSLRRCQLGLRIDDGFAGCVARCVAVYCTGPCVSIQGPSASGAHIVAHCRFGGTPHGSSCAVPACDADAPFAGSEPDPNSKGETHHVPRYSMPVTVGDLGVGVLIGPLGGAVISSTRISCCSACVLVQSTQRAARLDACDLIAAQGFGLVVRPDAAVELAHCALSHCTLAGCLAEARSAATFHECQLTCNRIGAVLQGDRTQLSRCGIVGSSICALRCCEGSTAEATDCTLTGNGVGVECRQPATTSPQLSRCAFERNIFADAVCTGDSTPTLRRCYFNGSAGLAALVARCGSRPTVVESVFARCAVGVMARAHAAPVVTACVFDANGTGVVCEWRAAGLFSRNNFSGHSKAPVLCRTGANPSFMFCVFRCDAPVLVTTEGKGLFEASTFRTPRAECFVVTRNGDPSIRHTIFALMRIPEVDRLGAALEAFIHHRAPQLPSVAAVEAHGGAELLIGTGGARAPAAAILLRYNAIAAALNEILLAESAADAGGPTTDTPASPPAVLDDFVAYTPVVRMCDGGRGSISRCTFVGNRGPAVVASGSSTEVKIEHNVFFAHRAAPAVVLGHYIGATVRENAFLHNAVALRVVRTSAVLTDCFFMQNDVGIVSEAAVTGFVSNCTFIEDRLSVQVRDFSNFSIKRSQFFRCEVCADFAPHASSAFADNTCAWVGNAAVVCRTVGSTPATITRCIFYHGKCAVRLEPDAGAVIDDIHCVQAQQVGVECVNALNATVAACRMQGCAVGIVVRGHRSIPTVTRCTMEFNATGIDVSDSANPTVVDCVVNYNDVAVSIRDDGLGVVRRLDAEGNRVGVRITCGVDGLPLLANATVLDGDIGVEILGVAVGEVRRCDVQAQREASVRADWGATTAVAQSTLSVRAGAAIQRPTEAPRASVAADEDLRLEAVEVRPMGEAAAKAAAERDEIALQAHADFKAITARALERFGVEERVARVAIANLADNVGIDTRQVCLTGALRPCALAVLGSRDTMLMDPATHGSSGSSSGKPGTLARTSSLKVNSSPLALPKRRREAGGATGDRPTGALASAKHKLRVVRNALRLLRAFGGGAGAQATVVDEGEIAAVARMRTGHETSMADATSGLDTPLEGAASHGSPVFRPLGDGEAARGDETFLDAVQVVYERRAGVTALADTPPATSTCVSILRFSASGVPETHPQSCGVLPKWDLDPSYTRPDTTGWRWCPPAPASQSDGPRRPIRPPPQLSGATSHQRPGDAVAAEGTQRSPTVFHPAAARQGRRLGMGRQTRDIVRRFLNHLGGTLDAAEFEDEAVDTVLRGVGALPRRTLGSIALIDAMELPALSDEAGLDNATGASTSLLPPLKSFGGLDAVGAAGCGAAIPGSSSIPAADVLTPPGSVKGAVKGYMTMTPQPDRGGVGVEMQAALLDACSADGPAFAHQLLNAFMQADRRRAQVLTRADFAVFVSELCARQRHAVHGPLREVVYDWLAEAVPKSAVCGIDLKSFRQLMVCESPFSVVFRRHFSFPADLV